MTGALKNNVVVNGNAHWSEVFVRDFWGTPLSDIQSHKSFRPLTTVTFKLNHLYSEYTKAINTANHTYSFHVVNVLLHSVVTSLVTEAAHFVLSFESREGGHAEGPLITGLLFGLHPVHVEAVTNITSRGELLMSFFFLIAFLSFARAIRQAESGPGEANFFGVYLIPWMCMMASVFSKEQGATTLVTLVVWDFFRQFDSVKHFACQFKSENKKGCRLFLRRTVVFAAQTILVCGIRVYMNGETSPDFIAAQNPAGFAEDRFTRVFSVSWIYCRYIFDAIIPQFLAPDWSGSSIPLIESVTDFRISPVLLLWCLVITALKTLLFGAPKSVYKMAQVSFWGFLFAPFLLSSNLLIVIGLMKADRVIYLPLFGFCLLETCALLTVLKMFGSKGSFSHSPYKEKGSKLGYILLMLQLAAFCAKMHQRNIAWSHSLNLWMSAYQINPVSHHTMYNCGYELSLAQRYEEAENVLRPIGDPSIDGPANTFVYAMVLHNLDRCDLAHEYIDKATDIVEEKKRQSGKRDSAASLARVTSNLLVARGFCYSKDNIALAGRYLHDAVHADPTNEYALEQAQRLVKQLKILNQLK